MQLIINKNNGYEVSNGMGINFTVAKQYAVPPPKPLLMALAALNSTLRI